MTLLSQTSISVGSNCIFLCVGFVFGSICWVVIDTTIDYVYDKVDIMEILNE